MERYSTKRKDVRTWLTRAVQLFEDESLAYPVLVHCTSGKDRTGVVIAALLRILGVSDHVIVEEYLLSEGGVDAALIRRALQGLGHGAGLARYFARVDLERVRRNLLGLPGSTSQARSDRLVG